MDKNKSVDTSVLLPWDSEVEYNDQFFVGNNQPIDNSSKKIKTDEEIVREICDYDSLYRAMEICSRNVRWKDSVARFNQNALINLSNLKHDLEKGVYKLSPYSVFTIYEKKERRIVSTKFRDRIFQRSLCDHYLYDAMTRGLIYDNYACQLNKGTMFAKDRVTRHLEKFYRQHGVNGYVLKVDIHDYFGSTLHEVAKATVRKRVKNDWVYHHVCKIIDSFDQTAPDKGMALGSQVTQLIQLAMLDDLDHYIKEVLRIKYYGRYMDDFILIHEDKEYLKKCLGIIISKLSELGFEVSPKKTFIQPIGRGIHFLGFSFILTENGKVVTKVLQKKLRRERRKLKKLVALVAVGAMTRKHADECYQSWKSHVSYGDCHNLIISMDKYYKSLYENLEDNKYVQIYESKRPDYCASP